MAMSNAERQRNYRMRRDADPDKRREYIRKSKAKYETDKLVGKRKDIKSMTEREKRHMRKVWRLQKRKEKERRNITNNECLTPSPTPESRAPHVENRQEFQEKKVRNRMRAKCYRDLKAITGEIEQLKRKLEMYKKRLAREKTKNKTDSPRTKTRKLLRNYSKPVVKRTLFMRNLIIEQIKEKYKEAKKRNKITVAAILKGSILKKYGLKTEAMNEIGVETSRRRQKEKTFLSKRLSAKVKAFYLRPDNSQLITGMKKTKTLKKKKMQRLIMKDTMKNLHSKFLAESKEKISYSSFCKLRPFWVVCPTESDRETCLCKVCQNTQLILNEVSKISEIQNNLETVLRSRVCDTLEKSCMYGECRICKEKNRNITLTKERSEEVKWQQWTRKTEKRVIKTGKESKEKIVSFTVKEIVSNSVNEMMAMFEIQCGQYMKHIFNCRAQFRYFQKLRENLQPNECIVHVDFSENFTCKLSQEIQSMHFGASKKQITLHTGVYYVGNEKAQTFATVSDSLQHGPAAVCCHLAPVLNELMRTHTELDTIEFFSDGPTAQYKQKGNFHLLSTEAKMYGFTHVKWSFFESGHGKGIPDAVGGSLKRAADRKVKYGTDIKDAKDFVDILKDYKSKLWLVAESDIETKKQKLDNQSLKTVPGTFKVHQVEVHDDGLILKHLSCACRGMCEHSTAAARKLDTQKQSNEFRKGLKRRLDFKTLDPNKCKSKKKLENEDKGQCSPIPLQTQLKSFRTSTSSDVFNKYLTQIETCRSYKELEKSCKIISKEIDELKLDPHDVNVLHDNIDIDSAYYEQVPIDAPENVYPCRVHADGNCLPSSGSVFAFKNTDHVKEIRVRIVIEQIQNENHYLSDDFLEKGYCATGSTSLTKQYAQYAESFIPGSMLTSENIKTIYRQEVLSVAKDKTFMGIWQMHALSSVLQVPIFSVYPTLGNPVVRKHLNRLINPVQGSRNKPVCIMWASNREDMRAEHWVPNHFVPLVAVPDEIVEQVDINNNSSPAKLEAYQACDSNESDSDTDVVTVIIHPSDDADTKREPDLDTGVETVVQTGKNAASYMNTHVIVDFNGKPYIGLVEDSSDSKVLIECMRKKGSKSENAFYWPKKNKDRNWYSYERVLGNVTEVKQIPGKRNMYKLDDASWKLFSSLN